MERNRDEPYLEGDYLSLCSEQQVQCRGRSLYHVGLAAKSLGFHGGAFPDPT
jgi:hypothetical protein